MCAAGLVRFVFRVLRRDDCLGRNAVLDPTLKRTERVEEVGLDPQSLIHARNHEEMCVALQGMVAAAQLGPVLVEADPPIF